jgi:hypothetical protein
MSDRSTTMQSAFAAKYSGLSPQPASDEVLSKYGSRFERTRPVLAIYHRQGIGLGALLLILFVCVLMGMACFALGKKYGTTTTGMVSNRLHRKSAEDIDPSAVDAYGIRA